MNPSFSDTGIVIKSLDFYEADRLIGIVSQNHGLVELIAKGARRITSKKAPHLDLLNLVRFQVVRGRPPQILSQAELSESYENIKSNLDHAQTALYLTEILNRVLAEGEKDRQMFLSLKNYLQGVNSTKDKKGLEEITIQFQLYLLRHLGFPPPPKTSSQILLRHFEDIIGRRIKSNQLK